MTHNDGEYNKIMVSHCEINIEPISCTIDYKDIDFILYIWKRYDQSIQPEITKLMTVLFPPDEDLED